MLFERDEIGGREKGTLVIIYPTLPLAFQVLFHISIESQKCPSHGKPEVIKIKPLGFTEEVEVVLTFICDCPCAKNGVTNSDQCSEGNGTFECGACKYVFRIEPPQLHILYQRGGRDLCLRKLPVKLK